MNINEIHEQIQRERDENVINSGQWTLGELIDALNGITDMDKQVRFTDLNETHQYPQHITYPDRAGSWRGIYKELAIGYDYFEKGKRIPTVKDILILLKGCVGTIFEGYKGGEYKMELDTPVWVDNSGQCSHNMIYGIKETDSFVVILVKNQEPYPG